MCTIKSTLRLVHDCNNLILRAVKLLNDDSRSEFEVDSEFCYYQLKSQTEVQIFDDVKKCQLTTYFRLLQGTLTIGGVGGVTQSLKNLVTVGKFNY